MPLDAPTFDGETQITVTAGMVSSAHCTSPLLSIDDDPATAAAFTSEGENEAGDETVADITLPGTQRTWIDTGTLFVNGDGATVACTGQVTWVPFTSSGRGTDPGGGAVLGMFPGVLDGTTIKAYAPLFLLLPDGETPAAHPGDPGGHQYTDGIFGMGDGDLSGSGGSTLVTKTFTPEVLAATITGTGAWRLWVILNDDQPDNNSGSFALSITPIRGIGPALVPIGRYLRLDWNSDRWITRVRLRMAGEGSINAAIGMEAGLSPGPDGSLIYLPTPLPSDENNGPGVDEILFDPPLLARSLVVYPDYLATEYSDTGSLNLYQLQTYESKSGLGEDDSMAANTQTATNFARVSFQEFHIFPWVAGKTLPTYAANTGSHLEGLKSLEVTEGSTTVMVEGNESIFALDAFETKRDAKYKGSVAKASLKTLLILQGGRYVQVDENVNGGEVQYIAPAKGDRAPYFFAYAKSTNGNGTLVLTFVKCKITGPVSYNLNDGQPTNLEFEFAPVWDATYVCQDATVGGIYERLFGAADDTTIHS